MTFTVLCIYKLYFFWSVIYTLETIWQFIVTYRSNAFCILKTTKIIKEIVVDNDFVWFSYLKKTVFMKLAEKGLGLIPNWRVPTKFSLEISFLCRKFPINSHLVRRKKMWMSRFFSRNSSSFSRLFPKFNFVKKCKTSVKY